METEIERDNEVQVIGVHPLHGGKEVALLFDFPEATILPCKRAVVPVTNHRGIVSNAEVLLLPDTSGYFVEQRVLKETIFGSVHCAFSLTMQEDGSYSYDTSSLVAIKKYSKEKMDNINPSIQENPLQEFAAMQYLGGDHPNIMGQICCLEDESQYYSVMPFCAGGELLDNVEPGGMSEERAQKIFKQILNGMEYLKSKGVAHRDISLENILVDFPDDDERVKVIIIDWGMAVRVPRYRTCEGWKGFLVPPQGVCGKKKYISPEVINNGRSQTRAPCDPLTSDVWALGVVLFMLLTEIEPFEVANDVCKRFRYITSGRLAPFLLRCNRMLSPHAVNLLQGIFTDSPATRMTIEQIKTHPWLSAAVENGP